LFVLHLGQVPCEELNELLGAAVAIVVLVVEEVLPQEGAQAFLNVLYLTF
jgi:hypothetical protein